jgi:hypothetical protein
MSLPEDKLDFSVFLYRKLQNKKIYGGNNVSGVLPRDIDFFQIIERLDSFERLISSSEETRTIDFTVSVNFVSSVISLTSNPATMVKVPNKFYVADLDFYYPDDSYDEHLDIKKYLDACKLFSILELISDHLGGVGTVKKPIFLGRHKVEVLPSYRFESLRVLDGLKEIEKEYIQSDVHKEQKILIIKTVIQELFCGETSFDLVLRKFDEISHRIIDGYQLYISEFSFQKIKADIEKEKLDATIKLNKVFSDIQNQLLAVPAALILSGGQMTDNSEWSSKNFSIWLGVLIFSIFMDMLVRNQVNTLNAVDEEIKIQRRQIEEKHRAVAHQFADVYDSISKRHAYQHTLLIIVSLLVSISLGVCTWLLILYSVKW